MHNINNTAEVVIGYVNAGRIASQRIFIDKSQLPTWTTIPDYPVTATSCTLDTVAYNPKPMQFPQDQFINFKSFSFVSLLFREIPVLPVPATANAVHPDYLSSRPLCVDCTLRGTVKPPAYWK